MKVLITGGAGFIGSHLSKRLIRNGHEITIVDVLHPYYSIERKVAQLEEVKRSGSIQFYQEDLISEEFVQELFRTHAFDSVIHLAAIPGVPYSIQQPRLYIDHNLKPTVNVLKWAGETGVKKVIFASSSSVYGNLKGAPLTEEMAKGEVISPYAATKVSGEAFCHVYQELYGFQLAVLRFFTVYGPWGRPDMAITKFIRRLLAGEEIEVYGKGSGRDYTYIDDITNGIELALHSKGEKGVYNLGSGNPILLEDLVNELNRFFPEMKTIQKPWRTGDVEMTWANIEKAHIEFGYLPKTSFTEGLSKTIEWAKEHPQWV